MLISSLLSLALAEEAAPPPPTAAIVTITPAVDFDLAWRANLGGKWRLSGAENCSGVVDCNYLGFDLLPTFFGPKRNYFRLRLGGDIEPDHLYWMGGMEFGGWGDNFSGLSLGLTVADDFQGGQVNNNWLFELMFNYEYLIDNIGLGLGVRHYLDDDSTWLVFQLNFINYVGW